jgi:hypothetical protein
MAGNEAVEGSPFVEGTLGAGFLVMAVEEKNVFCGAREINGFTCVEAVGECFSSVEVAAGKPLIVLPLRMAPKKERSGLVTYYAAGSSGLLNVTISTAGVVSVVPKVPAEVRVVINGLNYKI